MKRITLSLILVAVGTGTVLAQSVDQGKKFLYYERYRSAKEQFEKAIASNPNNLDAVYWLGQVLLDEKNPEKNQAAAKDLYQKALGTNGSAPLILVGMGQIALTENNTNDAKQRFETAISLTKSKDIDILNRVAAANVNTKAGDANYAIEKLNAATQIKNFKNPDTYLIMGDAYRKLIDGGGAITNYQKALGLDPKLAAAKYKIGKIYLTQGNKEFFIPAFEEAVQLDPAYAPALYELFIYYYYHSDVDKASDYFDKYLAVSDPGPNNDYDRISMLYIRKKYAETISASQEKLNTLGDKADPRYYKLIAYAYNDQGDSINAKKWLDNYFAKQKPEGFVPMDYSFRAQVTAKFPESQKDAFKYYDQAIQMDTVKENKLKLMTEAAALAKKVGDRADQARFLGMAYYADPRSNNSDLYNYGFAYYQAGIYDSSLAIFNLYKTKYPDEVFGYYWAAKSNAAIDTSMEKGAAVPDYLKVIEVGKKLDSVKYKSLIVGSLFYLASYSNDIKKDKNAAVDYLTQVTYIDPTNEQAKKFIGILTAPPKQPATKPAATKPKSGAAATPGTKTSGSAAK
ncbi:MAG: tetratricopeptide repeat protein [Bacteroidetes bacterium]|nr:tetratricopeptide repeat protein [Bacteroidota bacterium]